MSMTGGRILHLARHGETVWHAENRYAGSSDVELTERGRRQSAALGEWAVHAGLLAVAASDLSRAAQTAAAVGERVGLPVRIDPRLREVDFGRGEGLTAAEMNSAFPEARQAFLRAPASSPLPGGEPGAHAADRMLAALADVASDAGPVLVVAHTTVLRLALCRMLGIPLDAYREVFPALGNATVTTIRLPTEGPLAARTALLEFNRPV